MKRIVTLIFLLAAFTLSLAKPNREVVMNLDRLSRQPEIIQQTIPDYPSDAKQNGEEGTVLLNVLLNEAGEVSAASVMQSSGSLSLDIAARDALKKFRFLPAILDGDSRKVEILMAIEFQLEGRN